MILCLDVGNSQIYGGVFVHDELKFTFRKNSQENASSDEIGLFLKLVLRENGIEPEHIQHIALCSVVPDREHSLKNACRKYFGKSPFMLQAGIKSGLNIKYRNPLEVGADRIANAISAVHLFPEQNLIVVDLGTATTFCAISAEKEYLGGVIVPGMRISMEVLEAKTAKLPKVEIKKPDTVLGRSTVESIQSGIFYSHAATIEKITHELTKECFSSGKPIVIGTGGFANLFQDMNIFDHILSDLVLKGLYLALQKNI